MNCLTYCLKLRTLKRNLNFKPCSFTSTRHQESNLSYLSYHMENWVMKTARYKSQHGVAFPPFTKFSEFIKEMCRIKSDPGQHTNSRYFAVRSSIQPKPKISVYKPDTNKHSEGVSRVGTKLDRCIMHRTKHYMDDGLTSCPTAEEAIEIVKDTQSALKIYGNIRPHMFASNSQDVISAFAPNDLATNL